KNIRIVFHQLIGLIGQRLSFFGQGVDLSVVRGDPVGETRFVGALNQGLRRVLGSVHQIRALVVFLRFQHKVLTELVVDVQAARFIVFGSGCLGFFARPVIVGNGPGGDDSCFSQTRKRRLHHLVLFCLGIGHVLLCVLHCGISFIDQLVGLLGLFSAAAIASQ